LEKKGSKKGPGKGGVRGGRRKLAEKYLIALKGIVAERRKERWFGGVRMKEKRKEVLQKS